MACACCTIHVCSGECWQILHGTYVGKYNITPFDEGDDEDDGYADDEADDGEDEEDGDENEDEDEDEEQGAEILRGLRSASEQLC